MAKTDAALEEVTEAEEAVGAAMAGKGNERGSGSGARAAIERLVQARVRAGLPASDGRLVRAAVSEGVLGAEGLRRVAMAARQG